MLCVAHVMCLYVDAFHCGCSCVAMQKDIVCQVSVAVLVALRADLHVLVFGGGGVLWCGGKRAPATAAVPARRLTAPPGRLVLQGLGRVLLLLAVIEAWWGRGYSGRGGRS